MSDLEISRMLTLSTAHLTEATSNTLADADLPWGPAFTRPEGWMFYVPSEGEQLEVAYEGAPEDLLNVVKYTRQQCCEWLMLDADGPTVGALPEYEW